MKNKKCYVISCDLFGSSKTQTIGALISTEKTAFQEITTFLEAQGWEKVKKVGQNIIAWKEGFPQKLYFNEVPYRIEGEQA